MTGGVARLGMRNRTTPEQKMIHALGVKCYEYRFAGEEEACAQWNRYLDLRLKQPRGGGPKLVSEVGAILRTKMTPKEESLFGCSY